MKQETKIIIGGFSITLLVLVIVLFSMYKIYDSRNINEDLNNENKDNNTLVDTPTSKEDNNYTETNINTNKNNDNLNYDKANARIVTIYLFRGEGCPHCEDAIDFFNTIKNDYKINIEIYEVWQNTNNKALMQEIANKTNNENLNSVPFIVFDNGESLIGFGNSTETKIKENIIKLSKEEDTQYIKNIIDNFNLDVKKEELKKS
ncbi:MAG: hypothetical protein NC483_04120 [Ruminococcus sp.]|nr:hypothetical protein [Ruminococcus sp.]